MNSESVCQGDNVVRMSICESQLPKTREDVISLEEYGYGQLSRGRPIWSQVMDTKCYKRKVDQD